MNTEDKVITELPYEKFYPVIYKHIAFRPEAFGGYISNPYLMRIIPLSQLDVDILLLCDGSKSYEEIYRCLLVKTSYADQEFLALFINFTQRMNQIFAFKWENVQVKAEKVRPLQMISHKPYTPMQDAVSSPLSVLWDITYQCNLNCLHCLSSSGKAANDELSLLEAKHIIDELAGLNIFSITFCGGEPLIRKDIWEIFTYLKQYNIAINISSNGLLIDTDCIRKMDKHNIIALKISLDGREETHDRIRGLKGAYRRTTDAIQKLISAGYHVIVAPMITRLNLEDLDFVLEQALEWGAAGFSPSVLMPQGRGKDNNDTLFVDKLTVKSYLYTLMEKKTQYQDKIQITAEIPYPDTTPELKAEALSEHSTTDCSLGCSAGNSQFVITATGNIVPCPFLYDFFAGNIRAQPLSVIWQQSPVLNQFRNINKSMLKGKCHQCSYLGQSCNGGCRAAAYLYAGDLYAEDPLCWV